VCVSLSSGAAALSVPPTSPAVRCPPSPTPRALRRRRRQRQRRGDVVYDALETRRPTNVLGRRRTTDVCRFPVIAAPLPFWTPPRKHDQDARPRRPPVGTGLFKCSPPPPPPPPSRVLLSYRKSVVYVVRPIVCFGLEFLSNSSIVFGFHYCYYSIFFFSNFVLVPFFLASRVTFLLLIIIIIIFFIIGLPTVIAIVSIIASWQLCF